jgi:hypothetical protein
MATIVKPIAISDTLNLLAKEEAPFTMKSAPFINNINPNIINAVSSNSPKLKKKYMFAHQVSISIYIGKQEL